MDLNVVYSSDDNYAQHVGVSLLSLLQNNQHFNKLNIFLIENNLSSYNKKNLNSVCKKYNKTIQYINFNVLLERLELNIKDSIAINSYARLFLAGVIPEELDKIIYLDCDSIINSSLSDLWDTDITEYFVAGVCDTVSNQTKLRIDMDKSDGYINAGMLLINLKKWREENIEQKFMEFIKKKDGNVFHHDQGTINGVLKDKILYIHPKFNAMTPFFTMSRKEIMSYYELENYYNEIEIDEAVKNPVFIHYTPAFVNRPWIEGCKHPLTPLYKSYLDMTPWKSTDLWKDRRGKAEKTIALLYTRLPFRIAHRIRNLIFK
ncbi:MULTISPECIES: glycosyltransferase family 8 protein [Bacillus]|uniref:glycosyltransferase family 8 protein n=1 Tax=Bacillus TaxID=1386 RepID=UPI000412CA80|nr:MULTISPECIES: glycosyltransferase family 8 protein [Bacillus cereus group]OTY59821.1 glycosyl transferase family 8 [Bacillus thuringiensis serovar graciosensis]PFE25704.1 glycosyltransferase family 8 protein [Bacillus anthracis]AXY10758.1 glycosyltransferase family 8 protein [Bacillus thuringiensis LM1212]KXY86679.1 glycosyl transferase family 8 [Bacillus cereus]MBG9837753.1 glycosyl transferase family 8 [Bacillus tropicus]